MASFPYRPVAAATGLSDSFTERAEEPAAAHSHPKYRAGGAPVDPAVFIGTRAIDPICTVTDRRQVDLNGAPNRGYLPCAQAKANYTASGEDRLRRPVRVCVDGLRCQAACR
jgi:hypothetical protein